MEIIDDMVATLGFPETNLYDRSSSLGTSTVPWYPSGICQVTCVGFYTSPHSRRSKELWCGPPSCNGDKPTCVAYNACRNVPPCHTCGLQKINTLHHETSRTSYTQNSSFQLVLNSSRRNWTLGCQMKMHWSCPPSLPMDLLFNLPHPGAWLQFG